MKGIAGTGSLALPFAFHQVLSINNYPHLGWYHCMSSFIRPCLWNDDSRNVPVDRYQ